MDARFEGSQLRLRGEFEGPLAFEFLGPQRERGGFKPGAQALIQGQQQANGERNHEGQPNALRKLDPIIRERNPPEGNEDETGYQRPGDRGGE